MCKHYIEDGIMSLNTSNSKDIFGENRRRKEKCHLWSWERFGEEFALGWNFGDMVLLA